MSISTIASLNPVRWLSSNIVEDGHGRAGWGWVSDVPPKTAEHRRGGLRSDAHRLRSAAHQQVIALVRSDVVRH
jgi:hypothetical protein